MKTKHRISAFSEGLIAFIISCTILFAVSIYFNQFFYSVSANAISAGFISKVAVIGNYPIISDSRLFLLPLQGLLTMVLSGFPLIQNQEFAAQLLTILFTGGISTILLIAARRASIHPILRWLLALVLISHPLTIKAVLVGSGVPDAGFLPLDRLYQSSSLVPEPPLAEFGMDWTRVFFGDVNSIQFDIFLHYPYHFRGGHRLSN